MVLHSSFTFPLVALLALVAVAPSVNGRAAEEALNRTVFEATDSYAKANSTIENLLTAYDTDDIKQLLKAALARAYMQGVADGEATDKKILGVTAALDKFWQFLAGVLVFFMQPGFALLEAGTVRSKNTKNILFKNVCDACVGAIGFWAFGYAFAYGRSNEDNPDLTFIGSGQFYFVKKGFLSEEDPNDYNQEYCSWFFQFAFAATAATIVSGAVAERITFLAYLVGTTVITVFIYPVVVHWGWSSEGWASAFVANEKNLFMDVGVVDFAGCAVVHMVGGVCALAALPALGPRIGWSKEESPAPQSPLLQIFGTFILWFGWYGFNCGSTLGIFGSYDLEKGTGYTEIIGKTAVTTTLSAASACVTNIVLAYGISHMQILDIGAALNGILAGLVGITAACSVVEPWAAFVIGILSAFVYTGASKAMKLAGLDDVVDAVAVHCGCGAWGCLAAALFASKRNYQKVYGSVGHEGGYNRGKQFAANLCFVLAVFAWCFVCASAIYWPLRAAKQLRVSAEIEQEGMDDSKHGGQTKLDSSEAPALGGAKEA